MSRKIFGEPWWFWITQGLICGLVVELFIWGGTGQTVIEHIQEYMQ